jgi:hypothetical protein
VRSRLTGASRCPQCTRAPTGARASARPPSGRRHAARMRRRRALVRACVLLGIGAPVSLAVVPASAQLTADRWAWPVPVAHVVVHGFAPPALPWLPGHRGVDLQARAGTVVRAAGPGRVQFAGRVGHIWVVSVLHPGGLLTTYEPVQPLVRPGASVRRGQPLGRLLRRGSHCGVPCLHWGLRRGAAYLDPLALVGASRVRLLPLYRPDGPLPVPTPLSAGAAGGLGVAAAALRRRRRPAGFSRAGRRACRGAAGRPWCASGRSGSR